MIEDVYHFRKIYGRDCPESKRGSDVTIVGLMVSLDRMEVGKAA